MSHQCLTCPNIINYPKPNQKYCIICNSVNTRAKKKKKKIEKPKIHERKCAACGKEFLSEYKVEKFCSTDCRSFRNSKGLNKSWIGETKKVRTPLQKKKLRDSFNKFPVHLPKETISGN